LITFAGDKGTFSWDNANAIDLLSFAAMMGGGRGRRCKGGLKKAGHPTLANTPGHSARSIG
jgi:hypothetical protein